MFLFITVYSIYILAIIINMYKKSFEKITKEFIIDLIFLLIFLFVWLCNISI